MSAYEYAYWTGDTRMRAMLKPYVNQDEALKTTVYEQCKNIAEQGVEFELISNQGKVIPDSVVKNSKHFDYQPLMDAYSAFNAEATRLINANDYSSQSWA